MVAELAGWEALRAAGAAVKDDGLARLPELLAEFEAAATAAGAQVHWARDAAEAGRVVTDLVRRTGADQVLKTLAAAGIEAIETDLAELIVQLAGDTPSHILVPAIHYNRTQIREIFARRMPGVDLTTLTDDPAALAEAARRHLRERYTGRAGWMSCWSTPAGTRRQVSPPAPADHAGRPHARPMRSAPSCPSHGCGRRTARSAHPGRGRAHGAPSPD